MSTLTISQGLRRIKKLKGLLATHLAQASGNVTHLRELEPAFSFSAAVEKAAVTRAELIKVSSAVAMANAQTNIEYQGKLIPLTEALRTLTELRAEIAWVRTLNVRAQAETAESSRDHDGERWVTTTRTFKCHLPEALREARAQELQDTFDKLNDLVETTNHKTPLPTL